MPDDKTKPLIDALAKRQQDYRDAAHRMPDSTDLECTDGWAFREAAELVGCLRRLVEGRTPDEIHKAFGAPGDFGYETPIGDALAKVYRA